MRNDDFNLDDLGKRHLGPFESYYIARNIRSIEKSKKDIDNLPVWLHCLFIILILLYSLAAIILDFLH